MNKITLIILLSLSLFANMVTKHMCDAKKGLFIFAGEECINYFVEYGEKEDVLNIIFHGAWEHGADTLARYSTFATDIAINTDITTVAVALPGYSKSSSNNIKSFLYKSKKPIGATHRKYVLFMTKLIEELKYKEYHKII